VNVFDLFGRLSIEGIEQVDGQLASVEARLQQTGKAMTAAGRTMSMRVTAPLVALGTASFKAAGDFDQAFRQVNVMLRATEEESARYKASILDISSATTIAANDTVAAFYQIVSAGFRGADSLEILRVAMEGAVAGGADAATTTAALVKAMNIFSLEGVGGATRAMDTFFGIVDAGLLTFEELASSFPQAATMATGLGLSIEEVGAALATLTKTSGSTQEAATALNATFSQLVAPSVALLDLYHEWGVNSGPQAIQKFGDLRGVLLAVQEATGGEVDKLAELFPNIRAIRAVIPLVTTNADDFASALETAADSTGNLGEALDRTAKGPGFEWDQMVTSNKNNLILFGDAIASSFGPMVTKMTDLLTKAVKAFADLPQPIRTGAFAVGALAAAMGPLLMSMGFAATGLSSMIALYHRATVAVVAHKAATVAATTATHAATASTIGLNVAMKANPIGLVITLIAGLVTGIIALRNNWDKVVSFFDRSLTENQRKFNEWARSIKADADSMLASVESAYDQMVSSATMSAKQQIDAARQIRDAEKAAINERLGFYQEFTADKLGEIDKQMLAELAAIDGALGEQAQAYLDMLSEQDAADKEREDTIEARRIRELKRQLQYDEDLTRSRRLEIEDQIADYEAQQEKEKAASELTKAIKESDYEGYFEGQKTEADQAFINQEGLINRQTATQLEAYRLQFDGFKQMHENQLADTVTFVQSYNAIMAGIGGKQIEIPEMPTAAVPNTVRIPSLEHMAQGGTISEPTLLYGLRSQKAYAVAGEQGPERVTPTAETNITNHFSIAQLVVREEADVDRIAERLYQMQQMRTRYA